MAKRRIKKSSKSKKKTDVTAADAAANKKFFTITAICVVVLLVIIFMYYKNNWGWFENGFRLLLNRLSRSYGSSTARLFRSRTLFLSHIGFSTCRETGMWDIRFSFKHALLFFAQAQANSSTPPAISTAEGDEANTPSTIDGSKYRGRPLLLTIITFISRSPESRISTRR